MTVYTVSERERERNVTIDYMRQMVLAAASMGDTLVHSTVQGKHRHRYQALVMHLMIGLSLSFPFH